MSIFDRLIRRKESRAAPALVLSPGQAQWSPRNYGSFADEAYSKNVVAYQAINRIADAVASVKWTAWRGEQELLDHPILALLNRPNPQQSGVEYIRAKASYLMIAGNGYEERVAVGGQVRELYQLRPDRMKIVPSSRGIPSAYIYQVNQQSVTFEVDDAGNSDIRHLKLFNPLNDWYGQSPIEAGAYAVDQHNLSMGWMQALLQNSARPSGALVTKGESELSDDNFNRLKAQIEEQYAGASNAGRPMLLEGGLDWRQMGLSPVDMALLQTKFSAARDVSLAFGVPPQLLGIPGDNTYSNFQEARLAFWEDTVIPLLDLIASDWSAWLGQGEIMLKPDLDQVPAIADKRMTLWKMADKSEDLTINERRALKGYEPLPDGDRLQKPQRTQQPGTAASPELLKALAYGD